MRATAGRYVAGFAVVEDESLIAGESHSAPADRGEEGQLEELHRTSIDLIRRFEPDAVAVKANEAQPPSLIIALHAEGVALAATGAAGIPMHRFYRAGLLKPAGLSGRAKTTEIVDALCAGLDNEPAENEVRQAAAAARALLIKES